MLDKVAAAGKVRVRTFSLHGVVIIMTDLRSSEAGGEAVR